MLNAERQQLILTLLKEAGTVKTQELVSRLDTSESTIRRDLDELEEANMLKRVHGGATLLTDFRLEPSMTEKSAINIQSKKRLLVTALILCRKMTVSIWMLVLLLLK
ncbi:Glycerol-3-phosphate regulon repressor [Listeria grayi]|uniref:Glycerol-3-phosphate regulon repressor n=1 Tax=Listeria grayi TaxID=1641 RepID=A0A378MF63_LISGR|nr:Glycerol-3-phosphate regulon repressor [Listeria grayi]